MCRFALNQNGIQNLRNGIPNLRRIANLSDSFSLTVIPSDSFYPTATVIDFIFPAATAIWPVHILLNSDLDIGSSFLKN